MATLEKIRSKSALLFAIIIIALLAFILGDFLTSGRTYFGHPTKVAGAGNATVEYNDYQQRLSQAGEQMRNQGREVSNDVLAQNVIQQLLIEQLFKSEYDKLGIKVTDKELSEALTGDFPHPAAQQTILYLAQQLGLPEASGRVVYDAMQNPAKYNLPASVGPELRNIWARQEQDLEANMLQQKLMQLITGLYTYNKLDAKAFYDNSATTRTVSYVSKDAATAIADDEVEFSDADIEALWNAEKQNYRLDEPMREVKYIYVSIEPSQADRIAGQQAVENAIAALDTTAGTDAVAPDTRFSVTTQRNTLARLGNAKLRDFAKESAVGHAALISRQGNDYTIGKLLSVGTGIDSINVSILRAAPEVRLDSLAAIVGKNFADHNSDNIQAQDSIWTSLEGVGIDDKTKAALTNATIGKAFVLADTIQGQPVAALYRVNKRNAPVTYYEVAQIDFTVDPSQETVTNLTQQLRTYVSNNSSADEFVANAGPAGYAILSDQVGASSTGIGNARDSRRFVKWAMEAKKGQVSPMLMDDRQTYLLALAVDDTYSKYLPWTSAAVNTQLRSRALNDKKAAKLLEQYNGKANDLAGYAEAMGVEAATANVNITSPILLNMGVGESQLQGAIAAADKGQLVGPLKGNRGILVFQVDEIDTENRPFNEVDYGTRFMSTFGFDRLQSPLPLLLGKEKVENESLNFIQSVGE